MKRKKKAKALRAPKKAVKKKTKAAKPQKKVKAKAKPKTVKLKAAKRSPGGLRYLLIQASTTGPRAHGVEIQSLDLVTTYIRDKVRLGLAQVVDLERRLVMTVNGAWAKVDESARKEDPWVRAEFIKVQPPVPSTQPVPAAVTTEKIAAAIPVEQIADKSVPAASVPEHTPAPPYVAAAAAARPEPTLQGATIVPPPSDADIPQGQPVEVHEGSASLF